MSWFQRPLNKEAFTHRSFVSCCSRLYCNGLHVAKTFSCFWLKISRVGHMFYFWFLRKSKEFGSCDRTTYFLLKSFDLKSSKPIYEVKKRLMLADKHVSLGLRSLTVFSSWLLSLFQTWFSRISRHFKVLKQKCDGDWMKTWLYNEIWERFSLKPRCWQELSLKYAVGFVLNKLQCMDRFDVVVTDLGTFCEYCLVICVPNRTIFCSCKLCRS